MLLLCTLLSECGNCSLHWHASIRLKVKLGQHVAGVELLLQMDCKDAAAVPGWLASLVWHCRYTAQVYSMCTQIYGIVLAAPATEMQSECLLTPRPIMCNKTGCN